MVYTNVADARKLRRVSTSSLVYLTALTSARSVIGY